MAQKIFWRSALKAAVLAYFLAAVLTLVYLYVFVPNWIQLLFSYFHGMREQFEAFQSWGSLLIIGEIFAWGFFALIFEKIPLKQSLAKVFLFNAAVTLATMAIAAQDPVLRIMDSILAGSLNHWVVDVAGFLVGSVLLWYFFEYFKAQEKKTVSAPTAFKIASPKRRIAAYLVDAVILSLLGGIIFVISLASGILSIFISNVPLTQAIFVGLSIFAALSMTLGTLYWTLLEGKFGGTPGKRLLGLRVTKENGERIGLHEAFFRNAPKFFSGLELVLVVEVLFLLGTKKHQRLFDKIAETVVIRKQ